ncbi:MAG: class I SAM-dependent methyltransferase [Acidimicrobiales bacterium]
MIGYRAMLAARRSPRVERALGKWRRLRGEPPIRSVDAWLDDFVVPGKGFADIGGMWGVDGEVAVQAAERGAEPVTIVDFFESEAFCAKVRTRSPAVRFVQGSVEDPVNIRTLGAVDRVWCWGVLYHHPAPGVVLGALRMITADRLLLEARTIPELPGMPQAAVFWPYLPSKVARRWRSSREAAFAQLSIETDYDPPLAGANNFWGLTPSALIALARTYGFECDQVARSPKGLQRHVFDLRAVPAPYLFGFDQRKDWSGPTPATAEPS